MPQPNDAPILYLSCTKPELDKPIPVNNDATVSWEDTCTVASQNNGFNVSVFLSILRSIIILEWHTALPKIKKNVQESLL
jgi:hypothetical protein